jgi:SAM-dependent methyltransferase
MHADHTFRQMLRAIPGYGLLRALRRHVISAADSLLGTTDEQWVRVVMNRETRKMIEALGPANLSVLEVSGDAWGKWCGFRQYKSLAYPAFDVCNSRLAETFDLIVAEQVFEHLLWPYRAGKNVYQMLNPGGHFLVTTPFLIRIHEFPVDCSRWTECGIKYFLAECGFPIEQIRTGAWGNRDCIKANYRDWARYRSRLHSLRNEPDFPVSVWALAQK